MDDETQTTGSAVPENSETTSTQASEADVQTNTDAPEASQEVKETATQATETAEDKLYAGKYKSVDELEKAYANASSEASRMSQDKAELTRILNEAFVTPEPSETVNNDYGEPSPQVNPEFEQIKRDNAVVKFMLGHQDADGESMKKVLTEDPLIKQIQGHDAKLEYAYLRSQNIAKPKAIEEARKTAQAETQAKTVEKQAAQVESAKKSEALDENTDLRERATGNYDLATRDAARLAWIRKNLVDI